MAMEGREMMTIYFAFFFIESRFSEEEKP